MKTGSDPKQRAAPEIVLRCADTPALLDEARRVFREYAQSLDVDLCFQDFESELAGLPGDYAAPSGHLLLAYVEGKLAGCGAMRALADADYANACEMKRLYVRPAS
jgi:putative acetyltransferase